MKIKIQKTDEEVVYKKVTHETTFDVNGKRVRVIDWNVNDKYNDEQDADYEISEADVALLSEDEHEAIMDELPDLLYERVGTIKEVEYDHE